MYILFFWNYVSENVQNWQLIGAIVELEEKKADDVALKVFTK